MNALVHYLCGHAWRQGKTHYLATLLAGLKGTLIVRDQREAERVSSQYNIEAVPYYEAERRLRGKKTGIVYVDPDAVACWVDSRERQIERLRNVVKLQVERMEKGNTDTVMSSWQRDWLAKAREVLQQTS